MKYILIWVILLPPNPMQEGSGRALTSGSAQFDTNGACIDAASQVRSIEKMWDDERPVIVTRCLPSTPTSATYGACFDSTEGREEFLTCIRER